MRQGGYEVPFAAKLESEMSKALATQHTVHRIASPRGGGGSDAGAQATPEEMLAEEKAAEATAVEKAEEVAEARKQLQELVHSFKTVLKLPRETINDQEAAGRRSCHVRLKPAYVAHG